MSRPTGPPRRVHVEVFVCFFFRQERVESLEASMEEARKRMVQFELLKQVTCVCVCVYVCVCLCLLLLYGFYYLFIYFVFILIILFLFYLLFFSVA